MILTIFALAFAVSGQLQPQHNTDQPKENKERKICRTEQVTGSMMGKRVCHTAAEWKDIDNTSGVTEDQMKQLQSSRGMH